MKKNYVVPKIERVNIEIEAPIAISGNPSIAPGSVSGGSGE